ncbi:MAG: peptide ABC transporter substrate-binding protein [Planctomycetota bacterium]
MSLEIRRACFAFAGFFAIGMLIWAARFEAIAPAEFSFQNGTDPKTLDPHRATGQPESRIIFNVFSGLLQSLPTGEVDPDTGVHSMDAAPALAESFTVSDDGLEYTFKIREDAKWSDGTPITAEDFRFSWTRMLHPETLCQYAMQLHDLPHARAYNESLVAVGDQVEVELWDRPRDEPDGDGDIQNWPRGTIVYGTIKKIAKPPEPKFAPEVDADEKERKLAEWKERWVYEVDTCSTNAGGKPLWDQSTEIREFCQLPRESSIATAKTEACHHVLVAFDQLDAIRIPDPHTLIVTLKQPVPYFPQVLAYYPTFIVPRHIIEEHGSPLWTKPENIACCGPYTVGERLLRDRVRLVKNPQFYDRDNVSIETIDAVSADSQNTALNMYETGQLDWVYDPPSLLLEELKQRDDFTSAPVFIVYFYRINTLREPFDDPRVRRAIAMAIDRKQIIDKIAKAGQLPAYNIVPPGMPGYESPPGFEANLEEAKRLLAEAGFPNGQGFPKQIILYNTQDMHRAIAEVVQQQLLNRLGIRVDIQNMEWGSYLDKVDQLDYDIARAGWVGDYADPTTFLDLWISTNQNNSTGWANEEYDALMEKAKRLGGDPEARMRALAEAEAIFIENLPVIPFYFYVSKNLVKPRVQGLFPTPQDRHPFQLLSIEQSD